ncbi:MAG TPA: efflux RND transporter periplasmic adaptor subunit [Polyangiaceae bacterium]|nr:efflux RND transporter periplasmic adaptor subunit [Polyangiaceae bacterium]
MTLSLLGQGRSLVLPLFATAATLGCTSAGATPSPAPVPAVAVTTSEVVQRTVATTVTVTGTLLPNRESEVASDVAGRVVSADIERGSFVAKGALLARLDARSAVLGRREAQAQVDAARVQKQTAELECRRAEQLFASQSISRAELERAQAACQGSSFSTAAAQAREQMAERALGESMVRAPFAGMVVERGVDVGEYVTPGRRIATVVEVNPLRLEMAIPEAAATAVREGSRVEFRLPALGATSFTGTVRYVGPVLRRATRDLVVEALVENPDARLRPGMFAEARLGVGEQTLPTIPRAALKESGSTFRVFVVSAGVLEERVVMTGTSEGDSVAVVKGLRAGERVVSPLTPELRDGLRVR